MSDDLPQVSVDTSVVSGIVRQNTIGNRYLELLEGFDPTLTYFVRGELAAGQWNRERQGRLTELLSRFKPLDTPTDTTIDAFCDMMQAAVGLGISGSMVGDLWILAQTYENGLHFASHDSNAIRTADRADIPFLTLNERALELVRADRAAAIRG